MIGEWHSGPECQEFKMAARPVPGVRCVCLCMWLLPCVWLLGILVTFDLLYFIFLYVIRSFLFSHFRSLKSFWLVSNEFRGCYFRYKVLNGTIPQGNHRQTNHPHQVVIGIFDKKLTVECVCGLWQYLVPWPLSIQIILTSFEVTSCNFQNEIFYGTIPSENHC